MKLNIIEPNYFKDFHCIGGECRNNCCHDWAILLSKKEYLSMKNTKKSKELQAICDSAFHRLKKSENPKIYAEMRLKEDGKCQFLDKDGLCMLQKECGYNVLSQTCKVYPRHYFQFLTSVDRYLATSCEEVVNLLMNLPGGIELTDGGEIESSKLSGLQISIKDQEKALSMPYKLYWDTKTLIISIMKNRNYSVENRLILLGIAFRHIDELINDNAENKIPAYIDGLISAASYDKNMLSEIDSIEPNVYLNAISFAKLLRSIVSAEVFSDTIKNKFLEAYGITYTPKPDSDYYSIGLNKALLFKQLDTLKKLINGREYIYENIILNNMLYMNLPFSDTSLSFWDSYIFIAMTYSTMIFFLAGYIDENSTDKDLSDAIVLFSRVLFHSQILRNFIIEYIKENNFSTLASMVSLIRF